jgi:hypothetical protein
VPEGIGAATAVEPIATNPRVKGGISVMAKKAKGGKKKGGKKR